MKKNRGKRNRILLRLSAALLGVVLLCMTMMPALGAMSSSEFSEKTKQYDIAVVYDNSLSMFWEKGNYIERWSRAKFAMEIFASMLNYDNGDTLTIFPMWKVTTDGKVPTVTDTTDAAKTYLAGKKDYVKIERLEDINLIANMITIHADDTPFDAVDNAAGYLKGLKPGSDQHEKWLIILTDGVFDTYKKTKMEENQFDLGKEVEAICPDDVKIQYLAIDPKPDYDPAKKIKVNREDGFFVDVATGAGIQEKLIEICNHIFERNELPIGGKTTFSLDVSMKKILVFAQGKDVKISGLEYEDGTEIANGLDFGQRRYSDPEKSMGHGKAEKNPRDASGNNLIKTDTSLYGQVVTFSDCKTGNYKLKISGQPKGLQVFYAPDVRVQTDLIDQKTNAKIKEGDNVYPGEYIVKASVVDRQTGKDVTDSPLLGGDLKYTIQVKNAGKEGPIKNGDTIQLAEGEIGINVEVSYLKDRYTVRNTDSPFSWWDGEKPKINVSLPERSSLTLSAKCLQPNNWYQLSKSEEWQPVRVTAELNGQPLTDKQMKSLDLNYGIDGHDSVALSHKLLPEESALEIYIGIDKNGEFQLPEELIGTLKVDATILDEYERPLSDSAISIVEIHKHSVFWRFIVAGSITAGLIALVLWFMSRKVLPRKLVKQSMVFRINGKEVKGMNAANYNRKAKKLTIRSAMPPKPDQECRVSFSLYPVSRRWTPSRRRKVGINSISGPSMGVKSVTLNGVTYTRDKGNHFVAPGAAPGEPIKDESNGEMIVINANKSSLNCTLESR